MQCSSLPGFSKPGSRPCGGRSRPSPNMRRSTRSVPLRRPPKYRRRLRNWFCPTRLRPARNAWQLPTALPHRRSGRHRRMPRTSLLRWNRPARPEMSRVFPDARHRPNRQSLFREKSHCLSRWRHPRPPVRWRAHVPYNYPRCRSLACRRRARRPMWGPPSRCCVLTLQAKSVRRVRRRRHVLACHPRCRRPGSSLRCHECQRRLKQPRVDASCHSRTSLNPRSHQYPSRLEHAR